LTVNEIRSQIEQYKREGKKIFTSSSFQTHSIPLLHILSQIDRTIPVYFLNTGYHFPETIIFRDEVVESLQLNLVDLKPDTPKIMQLDAQGKLLFTSDPDHCCYLNKTQPLEQVLLHHDVWINGIRAEQSSFRSSLKRKNSQSTVSFVSILYLGGHQKTFMNTVKNINYLNTRWNRKDILVSDVSPAPENWILTCKPVRLDGTA
jgi:3'-phosphoadenosine 5'-phosphosulfate sulfotransferase (PAPS reductase)/FAD synthetase